MKNCILRLFQVGQPKDCFGLGGFDFFRCAILAASQAAISMVVHLEANGLEARFWTTGLDASVELCGSKNSTAICNSVLLDSVKTATNIN
jgi:hypothetical protein